MLCKWVFFCFTLGTEPWHLQVEWAQGQEFSWDGEEWHTWLIPSSLPLFLKATDQTGGASVVGFSPRKGESQDTRKEGNFPVGWAEAAALFCPHLVGKGADTNPSCGQNIKAQYRTKPLNRHEGMWVNYFNQVSDILLLALGCVCQSFSLPVCSPLRHPRVMSLSWHRQADRFIRHWKWTF